ncbi:peptidase S74 [Bacillus pseudomycoides]|uniref:phage tail spike protein n=1 Tax=Bacillus pseudomycoides TaxID=64104 RepID=UPI000BF6FE80|nr:phage tail spike protein [Bacillus pseudomycoides]PFZ08457.1 peptidase S74 [Bacillus pseudomycoides]PFZ09805.1 peptidase S74 [Bacillus pseudomycoides]
MGKRKGDLHIVDYITRQVIATIRPHDYIEDKRHWEIKNSIDILDVKLLESSKYIPYLQQQNIILKETRPGIITPYVITSVEKDSAAKTVTILASGEWTLLDADGYIEPKKFDSLKAEEYMRIALKGTDWEVGKVEAAGTRTQYIKEFVSPLRLLNLTAAEFNHYELQYRVTIQGASINKRYVDLVEKRGRYTGKEINIGKDLQGITRTENSDGVITALVGYVTVQGANGQDEVITVADINNGIPYVVDEEAFQRWNINGKHRFGFYTPETDNQNMTPERLMTLTKAALKKRVDTNLVYGVDAVSLARVAGMSHEAINEGDTVYIKDKTLNPPLYLEARAIAADESFKDPRQDKIYFGNYREIEDVNDSLMKAYQRILSSLQDKVPAEVFKQLDEKVNGQTDAIAEAGAKADQAHEDAKTAKDLATEVESNMNQMQTAIIESSTAPTDKLEAGKTLWLDSSDPTAKILKLWNGTDWEPLVPDTVGITTEITNIKGELSTKVTETQMQEYIGELGSDNLLLNTQFVKKKVNDFGDVTEETPSLERWNPDADAADRKITVDESKRYKQSRSVKIESTHTTTNVWHGIYQDVPAYQKQGKFQFSAMLYTDDKYAITLGAAYKIEFFNGSTSVGGYKQVEFQDKLVDGQWTRFTIDHDAPDVPITHARIEVWIRRAGTVWVAEPQCNVGEKLPVYMENPKDIVNYDAMVKEVADRVTKSEFNTVNSSYDTKLTQTNQEINLRAKSTDVYTKDEGDGRYGSKAVVDRHESELKVNAQEISLRVKDNEIAAKLNLTAQTALIQAPKINLDGYVEAKHIKTGSLKGVVIMTEDPSSSNNHMRLEKQNLTLYGTGRSRGYLGFVPTTDGSFTEALVLGNDYSGAGGSVNDSLVLDHTTPSATNFTESVASIGLASGKDAKGNILKSSYISFTRYGGTKMALKSTGSIDVLASDDIYLNASHLGDIRMRGRGYSFLSVGGSADTFSFGKERTQISNDFIIKLDDTVNLEAVATTYHNMHIKVHKGERNKEGFYFLQRYDPAQGIYSLYANVNCNNLWAAFDVSGVTWTQRSTREIKADIQAIQSDEVDALMLLKPSQYFLNKDVEEYGIDYLREHSSDFLQYGFVAEETPEQFQGKDKKSVVPYSLITVNIAATQQIMLRQNEQQKEINSLKEQNVAQEERISKLEALVQQLLAN